MHHHHPNWSRGCVLPCGCHRRLNFVRLPISSTRVGPIAQLVEGGQTPLNPHRLPHLEAHLRGSVVARPSLSPPSHPIEENSTGNRLHSLADRVGYLPLFPGFALANNPGRSTLTHPTRTRPLACTDRFGHHSAEKRAPLLVRILGAQGHHRSRGA